MRFVLITSFCFTFLVSPAISQVAVTFNKTLANPIPVTSTKCNPASPTTSLDTITTEEISLFIDNEEMYLVPLDVCGELSDRTATLKGCNAEDPTVVLYYTVEGGGLQKTTIRSVIIDSNKKTFCDHVSPCELLNILRDGEVTPANLGTSKISVSAVFKGFAESSRQTPSWNMKIFGSRYILGGMIKNAHVQDDDLFIGSICTGRQKSSCLSQDCGFVIQGLSKTESHFLESKGSSELPKCVAHQAGLLSASHSLIEYFKAPMIGDKLPTAIQRKINSSGYRIERPGRKTPAPREKTKKN